MVYKKIYISNNRDRYFKYLEKKFRKIDKKESFFIDGEDVNEIMLVPYTNHTYDRKLFRKLMDMSKFHKKDIFQKNAYYTIKFELIDDNFDFNWNYNFQLNLKDHFSGYLYFHIEKENINSKYKDKYSLLNIYLCGSHNIEDIEKDFQDVYNMVIESDCFLPENIEFINFCMDERTGTIADEMFLRNPQFRLYNGSEKN